MCVLLLMFSVGTLLLSAAALPSGQDKAEKFVEPQLLCSVVVADLVLISVSQAMLGCPFLRKSRFPKPQAKASTRRRSLQSMCFAGTHIVIASDCKSSVTKGFPAVRVSPRWFSASSDRFSAATTRSQSLCSLFIL